MKDRKTTKAIDEKRAKNAQRQKEYRERRAAAPATDEMAGDCGDVRLNTWISARAARVLARLAYAYHINKREMLERLVIEAERNMLAEMDKTAGDDEELVKELVLNYLQPTAAGLIPRRIATASASAVKREEEAQRAAERKAAMLASL